MQQFEYKVVPAPRRGEKTKTARTTPDRFAHALTLLMNDLGRDGWDYIRADTLPCDERIGLTGRTTTFQNMLVFRRALIAAVPQIEPPARLAVTSAPAERTMAEYASLTAKPAPQADARPEHRPPLTADAPSGDAPRIALVSSIPAPGPSVGPASGNGLAKP